MVVSLPSTPTTPETGIRPVNLRTDLGSLADLLELAFASAMDSSGRAAVREMRSLSHLGPGLNLLANLSDLAQGMSTGFVWVESDRLVGNVSVYPAAASGLLAHTWVIANVAVHPDYQRRGIATALMQASLELVRRRGGRQAVLQVDADNDTARRLYQRLGFVEERAWISWKRALTLSRPPPMVNGPYITHRRGREWRAEYALAQRAFPAERGGLGWLRPLHPRYFRPTLRQQLTNWINFRAVERLAIRADEPDRLLAALWIETGLAYSSVQLTLLVDPDYEGLYDEALINTAVRRFGSTQALTLEHPADRETTSAVLRRYGFSARRQVVHMRWDAPTGAD